MGFIGKPYFSRNGSPTTRRPLEVRAQDWMEEYEFMGTDPMHIGDWESGIESGPPHSCSIYAGQLYLVPQPDSTGDNVDARYVRDLGTLVYRYDAAGNWNFFLPDGVTPLPDTYTSAWFTDGRDLVRYRSKYYLYAEIYRSISDAQVALAQYQEELSRVRTSMNKRLGPAPSFRGYL